MVGNGFTKKIILHLANLCLFTEQGKKMIRTLKKNKTKIPLNRHLLSEEKTNVHQSCEIYLNYAKWLAVK